MQSPQAVPQSFQVQHLPSETGLTALGKLGIRQPYGSVLLAANSI